MVAVVAVFLYRDIKSAEERIVRNNESKLSLITRVIKNSLMHSMLEGKGMEFKEFVKTLYASDLKSISLYRKDGSLIVSNDIATIGSRLDMSSIKDVNAPQITSHEEASDLIYAMTVPIHNERPCQRCHTKGQNEILSILKVEMIMDTVYYSLKSSREGTLISYFFTLLILMIVIWVLTTVMVTWPLDGIVKTIKKVEQGDLQARFLYNKNDEIGELATCLNSMLDELNRAWREVERCHVESIQRVEKMATIGELASAIAHEIKNPLAGISGAIQVFAEDFPENDPRKSIINEVLSEIERLDKAVRDLLSFAKPPEPHKIRTSPLPIIERTIRFIQPQASQQGIEINIVPVTELEEVFVDPEQMQQVFLNVMLNAIHSMPGGGTITVTIFFRPEIKEAEIVISDTGHGIAQEDVKNIFKPFFSTKHMGTGLGLAISKNLVEKNSGRIEVKSQVGTGSIFKIVLPMELIPPEGDRQ